MNTKLLILSLTIILSLTFLSLSLFSSTTKQADTSEQSLKAQIALKTVNPIKKSTLKQMVKRPSSQEYEELNYLDEEWKVWKKDNKKHYSNPQEEELRKKIFKKNLQVQEEINSRPGKTSVGENEFMDLTPEEFKASHLGLVDEAPIISSSFLSQHSYNTDLPLTYPPEVDWRDVLDLPIKDQQCGDCWAQASVSNLEALNQITTTNFTEYSVQQFVECGIENPHGCNGGLPRKAFNFSAHQRVYTEADFPYNIAKNTYWNRGYHEEPFCPHIPFFQRHAVNDDYRLIGPKFFYSHQDRKHQADTDPTYCEELKRATQMHPVTVAINANSYFGAKNQTPSDAPFSGALNHAVLLVGYTPYYWIVQNSWGKAQGDNGYYYLEMGNTLGICQMASYPINSQNTLKLQPKFHVNNSQHHQESRISINELHGSKFLVMNGDLPHTITNERGQTLTGAEEWEANIIPQRREQHDWSYRALSFQVKDKATGGLFEFYFTQYEKDGGDLVARNVPGLTFRMIDRNYENEYYIAADENTSLKLRVWKLN